MMEEEFQDCENVSLEDCDVDLSLLRLSSPPPYPHFSRSLSSVSTESSPLKRSSPVSEESDQPKRRRITPKTPISNTCPLRFTYTQPNLTAGAKMCSSSHTSFVPEKHETTTFGFNTTKTEKKQKIGYDREEEDNEETNDEAREEEEEEDCCGEGMRIERSGEGFIIRLKCRCKKAFRVVFSDHHLYFKPF